MPWIFFFYTIDEVLEVIAVPFPAETVYYDDNVPLFRRNGYRKPGAMIP